MIGAETIEGYIRSLGINMESYELFVVLEIVQVEGMGQISRTGFVNGWRDTGMSTPTVAAQKVHARSCFARMATDAAYFRRVYRAAFASGKEPDKRALDLDVALVFWDLLLDDPSPRPWRSANVDWLAAWKRFLGDKWTRSVNRDMWNQALEFANKTMEDESLAFWSEDSAWPSVIDDFVSWARENGVVPAKGGAKGEDVMEVD
jgi:DCN1-like protein 1/2